MGNIEQYRTKENVVKTEKCDQSGEDLTTMEAGNQWQASSINIESNCEFKFETGSDLE